MNKIEQHLEVAQRGWSFVWKFAIFAQEHLGYYQVGVLITILIEKVNMCYKFEHYIFMACCFLCLLSATCILCFLLF